MWPFARKQSLTELGALRGLTDRHSHLLPGVDDGMRTMADSIAALHAFEEEGVKEIYLTPHIMEDYPNSTNDLRKRFEELSTAYATTSGANPIRLHLAAEHMLDTLFAKRFAERDVLTLGNNGDLLVETSYFNPPANLYEILADITSAGYRPVLAHPERYIYMRQDDYTRLHESGIKFQLNLTSAAGAYGPEVAQRATYLLDKGYYCMAGSDTHSIHAAMTCLARPIKASTARKIIELINQQNQDI